MPTQLFTWSENRDGVEILRVSGEIEMSTAPRLARALDRALDRALVTGVPLIADLSEVVFMDSAGSTRVLATADRAASGRVPAC